MWRRADPASWTATKPSRAICSRPAAMKPRNCSAVASGTAARNSGPARLSTTPDGLPSASRRISPPSGDSVSPVMPALSKARRLPHTAKPCSESSTTGWSGTLALRSSIVGYRFAHAPSSQPRPRIHSPAGVVAARSATRATASFSVSTPMRETRAWSSPRPATWVWESTRPGRTVAPSTSRTSVSGPMWVRAASALPTKRMTPSWIATASASGCQPSSGWGASAAGVPSGPGSPGDSRLLVAQRLDGVEARRLRRRVDAEGDADHGAEAEGEGHRPQRHVGGRPVPGQRR